MKKILVFAAVLSAVSLCDAGPLETMAAKLIKDSGIKNAKVAVLEFPYVDGRLSPGPRIIRERLTTFFASRKNISLVERALIDRIMKEHKFSLSGTVKTEDIRKLGKLAGAEALVVGTISDLKNGKAEINARIVLMESGRILSGGNCEVEKDWKEGADGGDGGKPAGFSRKPLMQIAVLLDTYGSMEGLIDQARNQIWRIVNELSSSEKDGDSPRIEVALYEYGNSSLPKKDLFIRRISPFTVDLDEVARELFSLKTEGGLEYCGAVLEKAVNELKWSGKEDVYKAVFIAGNEPFTQGPVNYRQAVEKARKKNIFINTIFCGPRQQGIGMQWEKAARLSGGDYANIDMKKRNYAVQTPYDDEITALSSRLNETYVAYGDAGRKKMKEKAMVDRMAFSRGSAVAAARTVAKAEAPEETLSGWDLVADYSSGRIRKIDALKDSLPEELKGKSEGEIREYIERKARARENIKKQIADLNRKRKAYLKAREKEAGNSTFGSAVIEFVKRQAAAKGYKFGE